MLLQLGDFRTTANTVTGSPGEGGDIKEVAEELETVEDELGIRALAGYIGQCSYCFTEFSIRKVTQEPNNIIEIIVWHDLAAPSQRVVSSGRSLHSGKRLSPRTANICVPPDSKTPTASVTPLRLVTVPPSTSHNRCRRECDVLPLRGLGTRSMKLGKIAHISSTASSRG
jgi:hypothetical protein